MRIAFDVRLLDVPGVGGARYAGNLLGAMVAQAPEDDFCLLGGPGPSKFPRPTGGNVHELALEDATLCNERFEQFTLPAELAKLQPDVFVSPNLTLPMLRVCPSVLVIYDLGFEAHPEFYDPGLRRYLRRWVRPSCGVAERIVTLSDFAREELVSAYGLSRDKVQIIPGAADGHFRPAESAEVVEGVRRRYGITGPFVLSLASMERNKNLPTLLHAFAQAAEQVQASWSLVLAGKPGPAQGALESLVRELGLQERVILTGFVPDDILPALYSGAGLFAFVSLYEGFGLPPLEAMACGAPVLCSNATSLPEVVGDAAVLVDPGDEAAIAQNLAELMADEQGRAALSRAGIARAGRFPWQQSAQFMLRLLHEVGRRPTPVTVSRPRPKRILVSRIGARGDVLQATPVLAAIKAAQPDCELTFHTSHGHPEMLLGNPHIDVLHTDDRPLDVRRFDQVINLNGAYEQAPDRDRCHRIDLYARRAGVQVQDTRLVFIPTEDEYRQAEEFAWVTGLDGAVSRSPLGDLRSLAGEVARRAGEGTAAERGIEEEAPQSSSPLLAFGLRSVSVLARCWFDDRWQELADHLGAAGLRILTCGAPGEAGLSGEHVVNTMGQVSMRVARALIERCSLFVTVDTAWVHVAASAGLPIVGLFGADLPECVLPPEGSWIGLRADVECSPCFSASRCDRRCMAAITVDHVEAQIHRALGFIGASANGQAALVPSAESGWKARSRRAGRLRTAETTPGAITPPRFQEVVLL